MGKRIKIQIENVLFDLPKGVAFECQMCGMCCKEQPADISEKEFRLISARGYKDFTEKEEVDVGFGMIQHKRGGGCFFLTKEGKCEIYEVRPATCRLSPFTITDYNTQSKLIKVRIDSRVATFCKGFVKGNTSMEELKRVANAAQTVFNDLLALAARKTGLSIDDERVALIAKEIILDVQSGNF